MSTHYRPKDIGALAADEWRCLCQAEQKAKKVHLDAYQRLVRKVNAVRRGEVEETPSPDEWAEVERTKAAWQALRQDMRAFVSDAHEN
jgi:hypothetical protein